MLKNYLKITFRKLIQQKMYSIITISGLAVGIGVFLIFFAFYSWKMTPDSFHKDIDKIYNIVQVLNSGSGERHTAYIPFPLASSLKDDIAEIEDFTRFYDPRKLVVNYENKRFYEDQVLFVDPNFLSFFTFNIVEGNTETLFSNPQSVVISETIAEKYFGDEPAVGEVLTLNNEKDLIVTGIFEDLEKQQSASSLYGNIIVPISVAQTLYDSLDDWDISALTGFIRLQSNADLKQVENKLGLLRAKYYDNSTNSPRLIYLFPTKGLVNTAPHIERFANYSPTTGATIMLTLGFILLLIGIFNYVNLSTARYTERVKELGVRKVVGAARSHLVKQFLVESVLTALIAYPLIIIIYDLVYSFLSSLTPLMPLLSFWDNERLVFASLVITLGSGLVAGIYPAIYLSSFRPVHIFKGGISMGKGKSRVRKVLVTLQFSISVILVVLALTMQKQSEFIASVDLGYSRQGMIAVTLEDKTNDSYPIIKERLRNVPGVLNVSAARSTPGNWQRKENVIPEGIDPDNALNVYFYGVHYDFFETMEMQITAGRSFQNDYQEDISVIINQLFADRLDWESPIGKTIKIGEETYNIVGVVNDCLFDNTFWPMKPTVFFFEKDNLNNMLIKAEDENRAAAIIDYVRTLWAELSPNVPYNHVYLDEYFIRVNGDAFLLPKILGMLGLLAVLYSSLGLLALSSYAVRLRRKEIGIRKVLGASSPVIITMLSKDFLKLVMLANIIALPIAYIASRRFLDFAFSIYIPAEASILVFATLITLFIALITTASQTLKASQTNPVESLRTE
ncbi:MAG: ABC transporter permease [candidate division Zixibacteria bacterium]